MNWLLLRNSLLVSGLTTLVALSFGFMAALWLAGLEGRWRNRWLAIAVIALALPPFLVTNCWIHFLGGTGVWRQWLPLDIYSLGGAVWVLSLLMWPITLFAVLSSWHRLQASQLESDLAVRGWALIRALLWPLTRTALAQAAVLTFVLALNNFAVPAILQVKVFPAEIWVRFNTAFDTIGALKLSWPLVIAPLLLLLWFARRDAPWPRLETPVPAKLFRQQLGSGWFWCCGAVTIVLCLLAVGLPLFQLVSVPRTWTELPGALAAGKNALWNSFWLSASSVTAIIVLSLMQTMARARRHAFTSFNRFNLFNSFSSLSWLLWLPFLVPGVLLGIGLITLFNRPFFSAFYQSAGVVIAAFMIRYLAFGWNGVQNAIQTVDRDLTDAARLEGAGPWQLLRYVYWPQIKPQVAAAGYITFLLCLWDVESMILVMPPGGETLAVRIFNLLHYGYNAQVNALCLTLLILAMAPLLIWKGGCLVSRQWSVVSGIARHASRTILLLFLALLLSACAPPSPSAEASINSHIFSRVQIIGSRGVGAGELNKPRSVAVDSADNLYVVDMTARVQKFSSNAAWLLSWQMPETDKGKPKGMCRDLEGNIVVLEPHYQRVNHFSAEGKLLGQWGQKGTNAGQFMLPRAVAVNSRGEVFVSEYGAAERVQKFVISHKEARPHLGPLPPEREQPSTRRDKSLDAAIPAGRDLLLPLRGGEGWGEGERFIVQFLSSFGHAGTAPGEFNRPEGLCVDSRDRVYVADSCNHRIQIFSSDGKFLRAYGKAGSGKGQLSYPYDICVDKAGLQYVCEFGNSRIQIFDGKDQSLEIIGGPGTEPGQFSNPWGVALDSAGNLYVADALNHRVQKFVRRESVVSSQWSVALAAMRQSPTTDYELLTTD